MIRFQRSKSKAVEHIAGFNSPQPVAPPELLPTVITGCVLVIGSSSIMVFAISRASFGTVKKATSVTGAARAADASEVKRVYTGSDLAPQVKSNEGGSYS
jgi:hypothetical protein